MSNRLSTVLNILSVLILVGAVAAAGYFYYQYKVVLSQKSSTRVAAEVEKTIKAVGNLMVLPKGESPTLATVTDVEKLRTQDFFKNAQNGDKVLIYQKALKAILYRPSTNKIVDVGPVKLEQKGTVAGTSTTQKPTPASGQKQTSSPVSVALYNGSTISGVTATVEAKLKDNFPNVTVVARQSASRFDYSGILVVDTKGTNTSAAEDLAAFLGGKVGAKPVDEATPSADLLILIGNRK